MKARRVPNCFWFSVWRETGAVRNARPSRGQAASTRKRAQWKEDAKLTAGVDLEGGQIFVEVFGYLHRGSAFVRSCGESGRIRVKEWGWAATLRHSSQVVGVLRTSVKAMRQGHLPLIIEPITSSRTNPSSAPLTDAVIAALARLVDDSQSATGSRQPSHSEIEDQFRRADLLEADPSRALGRPVGKAKRVRGILQWSIEHDIEKGERLVYLIVALVRGVGGFREGSSNFVGAEPIQDLREAFASEGYQLSETGELLPVVLDTLHGMELTEALRAYVRRARRGALDAALITGTGKDLVEAVAAHVLVVRFGEYSHQDNFPTLVGQAFVAVGLCAVRKTGLTAQEQMDLAFYELACAVNRLRNREGTGHGRPFLPSVSQAQARAAIQSMGLVAARLLDALS